MKFDNDDKSILAQRDKLAKESREKENQFLKEHKEKAING